jgi:chromosome condensin MukBEF ATPase and DNA-binding subunit MukB
MSKEPPKDMEKALREARDTFEQHAVTGSSKDLTQNDISKQRNLPKNKPDGDGNPPQKGKTP